MAYSGVATSVVSYIAMERTYVVFAAAVDKIRNMYTIPNGTVTRFECMKYASSRTGYNC